MKKIYLFIALAALFQISISKAQTYQTFDASTTNALNSSNWTTSSGTKACNGGTTSSSFSSGNIAYFCTPNGTGSGSVDITVGGIIVTENYTHTSAGANQLKTTGNSIVTVDVASGKTLTLEWRSISNNSGTGFIKDGDGTWDLAGPINGATPYNGGFTLNAGTVKAGGGSANAFSTGPMVINGGTFHNENANNFTMSSLTIGGDFTMTGTGNPTFGMNVDLGGAVRTITHNITSGSRLFSGILSNGGLTLTGTSARNFRLSGANTYTGMTTVSGSKLVLEKSGGGTLPSTNDCTIDGGILQIASNQTLNNLTLSSGTLEINNGVTLIINGTFERAPGTTLTLSGTGNIQFGSSSVLSYSGASNQTTTNSEWPATNGPASVTVGSSGITLHANRTLSGTLTLNGKLTLGSNNLIIDNSGTISGASTSNYIVTNGSGYLQRNSITTVTDFPVGNSTYNPITIANSGTSDNFRVSVADEVLTNGTSGSPLTANAVDRTWTVTEEVAGSSDVTLTAQWSASDELSGFNRGSCYLAHYTASAWSGNSTSSASGSDPYTISRSGITSFSPFGVGSGGALPVDLISFEVKWHDYDAILSWTTASEINNLRFEIERSEDGIHFTKIGELAGSGNSQSIQNYSFVDADLRNNTANTFFYRLLQIDYDLESAYSQVIKLNRNTNRNQRILIHPNPFSNEMHISFSNLNGEIPKIKITNACGLAIMPEHSVINENSITLKTEELTPGIYFIIVDTSQQTINRKVIKH